MGNFETIVEAFDKDRKYLHIKDTPIPQSQIYAIQYVTNTKRHGFFYPGCYTVDFMTIYSMKTKLL